MTARTGLRRFVEPPVPARAAASGLGAGETCELCRLVLPERHTHLVDLTTRALVCSCRACYFLFTPEGAGAGRYRPVPERYLYDPDFALSAADWEELGIPVNLLFVFHHSGQDGPVAFYPGPAGATESLLPPGTWARVLEANPAIGQPLSDVEAVLLRRVGGRFHGYLVPVDACYDLVGQVRLHWRGFGGGEEVWARIDAFFAALTDRSERAGMPVGG